MKFSIKDIFSKCDQIRRKLWIWSHLLKKSLMENFIFYSVNALHLKRFYSWLWFKMHTLGHNKMILCLEAAHASIFNKLRQAFFIKSAHEAFCHS